ncbi:MAG: ATP-grasp domain-containing protein [Patescibacteria group bacterium]
MNTSRFTDGKPNLVVLHPSGTVRSYPFTVPHWRESYFDFFKTASAHFSVYYVRGAERHIGNGNFSGGYHYQTGTLVGHHGPIAARVVYNKNRLRSNGGRDWAVVNPWKLYQLTYDKYGTYRAFHRYMKPTYRVLNKKQLRAAIAKVATDQIVYKPLHGTGGTGVIIGSAEKIRRTVKEFPGLIQTFVDTTGGIPGLYRGRHDLRVTVMDGTIVQSFIRIPPAHLMVANVAQGARARQVPLARIPRRAKQLVHSIDNRLKRYGNRIYAVDMGFERGKPYIFEINPEPGLPYKHWCMHYREFHHGLIKTFINAV